MGAKTLLTLAEFEALPDDGKKYELNQGELVVMPPAKAPHTRIIQRINRSLSAYVYEHALGEVFSEGAYFLSRDPEPIFRQPDVSFLSTVRLKELDNEYFAGAPDLAIEVVSPGNDAAELDEKVNQYLACGSKEVWLFYPKTRSVMIHKPGGAARKLTGPDTITTDLFPGWSARVSDFFDLDY
jgi:Uma2 family endonuclease